MLSRSFTKREKILLLVLAILLLVVVYYQFVVKGTETFVSRYDVTDLENELIMEETKAQLKATMLASMGDESQRPVGVVGTYNNLRNEINALNVILSGTSDYNINFGQAIRDQDTVRRDLSVNFTASSYAQAKTVLTNLKNCQYRCLIKDMTVSSSGSSGGLNSGGSVRVDLTVTFYETMHNADTTLGLETLETESSAEAESEE